MTNDEGPKKTVSLPVETLPQLRTQFEQRRAFTALKKEIPLWNSEEPEDMVKELSALTLYLEELPARVTAAWAEYGEASRARSARPRKTKDTRILDAEHLRTGQVWRLRNEQTVLVKQRIAALQALLQQSS